MLDAARRGGYAYPAINVTSSQTLNAALQGFADAESDGIIQVSVGGAAYFSGQGVNDRVTGSLAFAAFAHEVAKRYPHITVALHTDHCAKQYLDGWVRPLLDMEADEVAHGREPMFQSHMWDGSTVPLDENLTIAEQLLDKSVAARTILEIEIGAVGGEEDGHSAEINEKLYSTPADGVKVAQRLGLGERGRYMAAFTFGNVHGSYKPGVVKLRPELLGDIQREAAQAVVDGRIASAAGAVDFPNGKPFALVFHGGSGSRPEEIAEAVRYGVVKGLHNMYKKSRSEGFGPEVKRRIMLGSFVLSSGYYDAYYLKALKTKALIKKAFDKAFEKYDVIVAPAAPTTAPELGKSLSDPIKMYLGDIYTISVNLAGLPGITIPVGKDSKGLPVGMQLIGNCFEENKIIQTAYTFEQTNHVLL